MIRRQLSSEHAHDTVIYRAGRGEPLVLLHGITAHRGGWLSMTKGLELRHEVVAFDLPGFGAAPPNGVHPDARSLTDWVEGQLQELELERAHLVGNSTGGWLAFELAKRGRALSVTAIAPIGLATRREQRALRAKLRLVRYGAAVSRPIVPLLARAAPGRAILAGMTVGRPWAHERQDLVHTVDALTRSRSYPQAVRWFTTHSLERLDEVRCPVMVIWGRRDRLASHRQARRFAAAIDDVDVRIVPALGHVPMTDDPKLLTRLIFENTARAAAHHADTRRPRRVEVRGGAGAGRRATRIVEHVRWPDEVDEVLGGDQVVMLATVTPANGVVLLPVTNFAVRDREGETLTAVNSSIGVSKKLERIRANPRVALAYHTRAHGWTNSRRYVLVQGTATLSKPDPRYMQQIEENFEFYAGGHPRGGLVWDRWLRGWHYRIAVEMTVERIVSWPDLECRGRAEIYGAPLVPTPPAGQAPPKNGTGPRLDVDTAAKQAAALPEALLGWVGADGLPVAVPARVAGTDERGIVLTTAPGLVPPGGRRAGFTAHWFADYAVGQRQRIHTGWLEYRDERIVYAPHTRAGYYMPPSKLIYKLAAGAVTNRGLREARRRGFLRDERSKKAP